MPRPRQVPSFSVERLRELVRYDQETGAFWPVISRAGCRPGQPLGHVEPNGYRRLMIEGGRYLAHRLAWFYMKGVWPDRDVDHRNLDNDDNAWTNLRLATDSQNQGNTRGHRGSRSGLKGAHWNNDRKKWQSYIKVEGRSHFLGHFLRAEDAHKAYAAAAKQFFGEFARTTS